MELPGKRKRGRSKLRFVDAVRKDMTIVEVTDEDVEHRTDWRWNIRCGDPYERSRKKKKKNHCIGQICLTNVIGWKRSQFGLVILTKILVRHISTIILVKLANIDWLFV